MDALVSRLRAAGCAFAEDEARLLSAAAESPEHLEDMVVRRVAGLPLEQIVGWAEFRGARVHVDPGVFVPRRRTEFLVELAVPLLGPGRVAVDLCCGTAAVGAALAREVPCLEVFAADLDPAAVACARRNLPAERVFGGDLFEALPHALRGRVDVLAVNAPYVPTAQLALMPSEARDHEHRVALDGGEDGLDVLRRVAAAARTWLAPGGHLLLETGRREAPVTLAFLTTVGLRARIHHSETYDATAVVGRAGSEKWPVAPLFEQVF